MEVGGDREREKDEGEGRGRGCLLRKRTDRERKRRRGGTRSACLGKGEIGVGQNLSLKQTRYPGDRPGLKNLYL